MTREEMREKVMMALLLHKAADDAVDAGIAIIRGETLEEAAKEVERMEKVFAPQQVITDRCAAAIRALKEKA